MTSNRIPTVITDVNGRVTTVHRRAEDGRNAGKALRAPAPTIAPVKPSEPRPDPASRTPLDMPEPVTGEQLNEYRSWHEALLAKSHYNERAKGIFSRPLEPVSQALAYRLMRDGAVSDEALFAVINSHQMALWRSAWNSLTRPEPTDLLPGRLQMKLRLLEKLAGKHPEVFSPPGIRHSNHVALLTDGYSYQTRQEDRKRIDTIDTEEGLASLTAVSEFLIFAGSDQGNSKLFKQTEFKDSAGTKLNGMWIANRSLDAYLREHPADVHRVIEYVSKRGIGNTVKDTKQLITYLNGTEGMGIVSEGWL